MNRTNRLAIVAQVKSNGNAMTGYLDISVNVALIDLNPCHIMNVLKKTI